MKRQKIVRGRKYREEIKGERHKGEWRKERNKKGKDQKKKR